MLQLQRILVPTDFGDASATALDAAVTLASKFDASIYLLHASWVPPYAYMSITPGAYWPIAEINAIAQKSFAEVLADARKRGVRVDGAVIVGEPWRTIIETAAEQKCDLVVMGTHGRRGPTRLLLGSVAEKVVRLCPVPVLTISNKAAREAKAKELSDIPRGT